MAVEQEKVKYKFGQKELDLDKYIHNLGTNLQRYLDTKTDWSDGQRQEFTNAYNRYINALVEQRDTNSGRFYSDDAGNIYDSTGAFSDLDDDMNGADDMNYFYDNKGNQITEQAYDKLRDRKKKKYSAFSANREVANYFNQVGRYMSPYEKAKKERFDLSKHGVIAYWKNKNHKGAGKVDLRPYLDKDPFDKTTGKRDTTNRVNYWIGVIDDHIQNLGDYDYDYSGSPFGSKEEYVNSLNNWKTQLQNGVYDNEDMIAGNQAGAESNFINDFFTTVENPTISESEIKAQDAQKTQEERDALWNAEKKKRWDSYMVNRGTYHKDAPYRVTLGNAYNDEQGLFNANKWAESFETSNPYYNEVKRGEYKRYINDFFNNPFNDETGRALSLIINDTRLSRQLADGRFYIPQYNDDGTSKDIQTNTALIYDPSSGTLKREFIGEVDDVWQGIKNDFNISQGWSNPYDKYEHGGVITYLQLGGGVDINKIMKEKLDQENKIAAQKAGKSEKEYLADRRKIGSVFTDAEESAINPDTSFTDIEYARIGGAIADIASIGLAFAPGAGTVGSAAAGISSTAMNAWADFNDDGVSTGQAFKNMFVNLGMDIVGLIPGGGAASKGAKILKSLTKILPKAALAIGAVNGLKNSDQILASINKAIKTPGELNVGDWQNIAQGLSLIAGGSQVAGAAVKNKANAKKAGAANNIDKKVAVDVVDSAGNRKSVLFEGEDAVKIKRARDTNNVAEINDILHSYESTKDFNVQQATKMGWQRGDKWYKWQRGDTGKGAVAVHDLKADAHGTYLDRGRFEADVYEAHPDPTAKTFDMRLTADDTIEAITKANLESQKGIADQLRGDFERIDDNKAKKVSKLEKLREQAAAKKAEIGTDTWARAKGEIDQLTARKNNPTYAQRKADLDNYKITAEANKRDLWRVENDIALLEANPPAKMGTAHPDTGKYIPSDAEVRYAQELETLRAKRDELTRKVNEDNVHINRETTWLDVDQRINDLQARETELTTRDAELANLEADVKKTETSVGRYKGKVPKSYTEFIRNHQDLDGNIFWDLPGGKKSKPVTVEEFQNILRSHGINFNKKGGNIPYLRKFQTGGVTHTRTEKKKDTKTDKEGMTMPSMSNLNPTLTFGLSRAIYSDLVNRDNTDRAIAAEKPVVKTAFQRTVQPLVSSNSAEVQGQQNASNLYRLSSKSLTSDANLHQAVQLDAASKAQGFINQGNMLSDEALKKSMELNHQIENENALARHNTAMENNMSFAETAKNKNAHEMAYRATRHNIYDTFLQQMEYETRQKLSKNEALSDSLTQQDISDMLDYDLGSVATQNGMTLSDDSLAAWKKVRSGEVQYTDLTDAEKQAFLEAENASKQLSSLLLRKAKGISVSPFFRLRNWSNNNGAPVEDVKPDWLEIEKKGGTLKENMKSEKADADRLHKQLKEAADRHQKMLNKLADSIYKLKRNNK